MLNIVEVQDSIIETLRDELNFPVYEQGVEDAMTVKKVAGRVEPYVAIQFGSMTPRARGRTFVGVRTFDYELAMQVQVVAASGELARKIMYGNVYDVMIGLRFRWLSQIEPDRIGGLFPITTSNGATEAYQAASGFRATLQLSDV